MESDLSAITSLSVLKLIEKAKNCPSQSSVQLNETLQNAGLIDCTEGRELSPWESSKTYRSYLKDNKIKIISSCNKNRENRLISLSLHSPNTHSVYVQYCKECIGMVHFVHKWNKDVEISLQGNFSNTKDEKKLIVMESKINTLIDVVQEQEDEIFVLKKRNSDLEKARIGLNGILRLKKLLKLGKIEKWRTIALMAMEDKECSLRRDAERWTQELSDSRDREVEKNHELNLAKIEINIEKSKRYALQEKLEKVELKYFNNDSVNMKKTEENKIDEIDELNYSKISIQNEIEKKLLLENTKKNERKALAEISLLNDKLESFVGVKEELCLCEEKVDRMQEEIRELKMIIRKKDEEKLQDIEILKSLEKINLRRKRRITVDHAGGLIELAGPTVISGKPVKLSFKAAASAVCCALRGLRSSPNFKLKLKSKPNTEKEVNKTKIEKRNNLISETDTRVEINQKKEINENNGVLQDGKERIEKGNEREKNENKKDEDAVWNLEGPEFDPMAVLGLTLRIQKRSEPDVKDILKKVEEERTKNDGMRIKVDNLNSVIESQNEKHALEVKKIEYLILENAKKHKIIHDKKTEYDEIKKNLDLASKKHKKLKFISKEEKTNCLRFILSQNEVANNLSKTIFNLRAHVQISSMYVRPCEFLQEEFPLIENENENDDIDETENKSGNISENGDENENEDYIDGSNCCSDMNNYEINEKFDTDNKNHIGEGKEENVEAFLVEIGTKKNNEGKAKSDLLSAENKEERSGENTDLEMSNKIESINRSGIDDYNGMNCKSDDIGNDTNVISSEEKEKENENYIKNKYNSQLIDSEQKKEVLSELEKEVGNDLKRKEKEETLRRIRIDHLINRWKNAANGMTNSMKLKIKETQDEDSGEIIWNKRSIIHPFKSPFEIFSDANKFKRINQRKRMENEIKIKIENEKKELENIKLMSKINGENENGVEIVNEIIAVHDELKDNADQNGKENKCNEFNNSTDALAKILTTEISISEADKDEDRKNVKTIINKMIKENEILCENLKMKADIDVKNFENLVYNLRKKELNLEETVILHLTEIQRLLQIINLQPEEAKKTKILLTDLLEKNRLMEIETNKKIEKYEFDIGCYKDLEYELNSKLKNALLEITDLKTQINILDDDKYNLIKERNHFKKQNGILISENSLYITNDKTIELENMKNEKLILESEIENLNLSLYKNSLLYKELEDLSIIHVQEKEILTNENNHVKTEYNKLLGKNEILKNAITDNYRLHEKECSKILKVQFEELNNERLMTEKKFKKTIDEYNKKEAVLLRVNNREVYVRDERTSLIFDDTNVGNNNCNIDDYDVNRIDYYDDNKCVTDENNDNNDNNNKNYYNDDYNENNNNDDNIDDKGDENNNNNDDNFFNSNIKYNKDNHHNKDSIKNVNNLRKNILPSNVKNDNNNFKCKEKRGKSAPKENRIKNNNFIDNNFSTRRQSTGQINSTKKNCSTANNVTNSNQIISYDFAENKNVECDRNSKKHQNDTNISDINENIQRGKNNGNLEDFNRIRPYTAIPFSTVTSNQEETQSTKIRRKPLSAQQYENKIRREYFDDNSDLNDGYIFDDTGQKHEISTKSKISEYSLKDDLNEFVKKVITDDEEREDKNDEEKEKEVENEIGNGNETFCSFNDSTISSVEKNILNYGIKTKYDSDEKQIKHENKNPPVVNVGKDENKINNYNEINSFDNYQNVLNRSRKYSTKSNSTTPNLNRNNSIKILDKITDHPRANINRNVSQFLRTDKKVNLSILLHGDGNHNNTLYGSPTVYNAPHTFSQHLKEKQIVNSNKNLHQDSLNKKVLPTNSNFNSNSNSNQFNSNLNLNNYFALFDDNNVEGKLIPKVSSSKQINPAEFSPGNIRERAFSAGTVKSSDGKGTFRGALSRPGTATFFGIPKNFAESAMKNIHPKIEQKQLHVTVDIFNEVERGGERSREKSENVFSHSTTPVALPTAKFQNKIRDYVVESRKFEN